MTTSVVSASATGHATVTSCPVAWSAQNGWVAGDSGTRSPGIVVWLKVSEALSMPVTSSYGTPCR